MDNHEKIVFVEGNNDILFFDCICKKLEIGNLLGNPENTCITMWWRRLTLVILLIWIIFLTLTDIFI